MYKSPSDWNWNPATKSVGNFTLGAPITDYLSTIMRLERFDYEEVDTFLIEDKAYSKLFGNENVYSIQCTLHFMVNGVNIIGKTFQQTQELMEISFNVIQDRPECMIYMNDDESIELITFKEDVNISIQYVIVRDVRAESPEY